MGVAFFVDIIVNEDGEYLMKITENYFAHTGIGINNARYTRIISLF